MKQRQKILFMCTVFLLCTMFFAHKKNVLASTNSEPKMFCYASSELCFVGKTYDLSWYVYDGKEYTASDFNFKTSNSKIATVTKTGKIKGIHYGDVTISMVGKKDKSLKASLKLHFYEGNLTISCNSKSLRAGKTYQLKGNHKNVLWSLCNVEGDDSRASIDSKSGKIKFRDPGEVYVYAKTADGKYYGAMYLKASGPVVSGTAKFKPVTVKKDLHLNTIASVVENNLLPKTITLPYTNGKKKGKVKCTLNYLDHNSFTDFSKPGTYDIDYSISAPDGYTFGKMKYGSLTLVVKKEQTDSRIKIVRFEPLNITLTKDFHVIESYEIVSNYLRPNNIPLIGITESGEKVEFQPKGACYPGYFDGYHKLGTYKEVSITAAEKTGYYFDYETTAPMTLKIKKKQTPDTPDEYKLTLDYIPGVLYVKLPVTQKKLR